MHLPDDDDELLPRGELDVRTAALQATVAAVRAVACAGCGAHLCGHAAVLAVVLGYKNRPRCPVCVGMELQEDGGALAERALQWILRRDCFAHVWRGASAAEGQAGNDRPSCLFAADRRGRTTTNATATPPLPTGPMPVADAVHDAGDLGCGDLVLELRSRLRELPPGAVLEVNALDPAAPVDLPAWCGLCGHTLLRASHPTYWIQRKRD